MNLDLTVALVTITILLIIIAAEVSVVASRTAECLKELEQIRHEVSRDR